MSLRSRSQLLFAAYASIRSRMLSIRRLIAARSMLLHPFASACRSGGSRIVASKVAVGFRGCVACETAVAEHRVCWLQLRLGARAGRYMGSGARLGLRGIRNRRQARGCPAHPPHLRPHCGGWAHDGLGTGVLQWSVGHATFACWRGLCVECTACVARFPSHCCGCTQVCDLAAVAGRDIAKVTDCVPKVVLHVRFVPLAADVVGDLFALVHTCCTPCREARSLWMSLLSRALHACLHCVIA
jgi:hypothetical protein